MEHINPSLSKKGPGEAPKQLNGNGIDVGIVHARWNMHIVRNLVDGAKSSLLACGVAERDITIHSVPGSWELPFACSQLCDKNYDAIIAIGVLIKGETMHFEYISDAVSHGLMRVQLDKNVPIVFGVLTVLDQVQAEARAGLISGSHNHGLDWGTAAVELGLKNSNRC